MESIWRKELKNFSEGEETETVEVGQDGRHREVVVVGAGMAGLLIAYYLKEQGKDVLVLEAAYAASGQTERTTAKITSQHGMKYAGLIKKAGRKKAKLYAEANEEAVDEFEKLIKEKKIECGFERLPAYLYSMENESALRREAEAAKSLGIDAYFTKKTELPFEVAGAVCFMEQAQFSPLKFVQRLCAELEIEEYTKIFRINGKRVVTSEGMITADNIVIATHYPILNVPGFYFVRQHQERSYVLALSECDKINGMYYGIDKNGLSFRMAGRFLLLGGGAHRTGKNTGDAYGFLEREAKKYFPGAKEVCRWSAQDCMPHDGLPFIGRYSVFTPHLYVATGFQKWGMTTSIIAAMILRDELCGRKNPYRKLFKPQRVTLRAGFGKLLTDVGVSAAGLLKSLFHRPAKEASSLKKGEGGIVCIDGKRYACYRDERGWLHKISAVCPHMGCELSWNPEEKSWDCPCHGSRFDADGKLLDSPARRDAKTE